MAAANRPPPCAVLLRGVDVERPSDALPHAWGTIRCRTRKSYGCGQHGQKLVEGLTLHLRIVDDHPNLTYSLCIRLSDEALRAIQSELGHGDKPLVQAVSGGREMYARGLVFHADESLVALSLVFRLREDESAYHLVYDAAGESLSMAPDLPPDISSVTGPPIPVRRRDGGGVDLVVMAKLLEVVVKSPEQRRRPLDDDGVLCVWHMAPPSPADLSSSCGIDPWQIKNRRFQQGEGDKEDYFFAHDAFSFDGHGFWVNLAEGVLHCDMRAAAAGEHRSAVDFDFITLPPGSESEFGYDMDLGLASMFRTMGSAGDSVKYVSIDHFGAVIGDRMVTVWTLHLDRGHSWRWNRDDQFSVRSLWELEGFKEARLPENLPKCPVVMPGGALWFLLPNKRKTLADSMDDHVCILDVGSMSVLWSGRVSGFHSNAPAVLPSSFIKSIDPLVPSGS
ncbi:unnamed protein product [Urochloa decumbens]|uniref:DUF1618 domain-containing protein n=1 Tax=Urochloa decumbens TaxID=240449 RepID=A0ABC9H2N5_9POAL